MRILVTGGAGFIGSHLVDRLLAAGHEPRIFDTSAPQLPAHRDVEHVRGDLLDPRALLRAAEGCAVIAHLAASADVGIVAEQPCAAEELNARGTLHVLEAARRTGARVLYASTIWAYSDVLAEEVDEDTGLALPSHLYTATKLAGEMYCRSYQALYGVASTILRFGIPYGPRARPAAVLPIFVTKALAGEPLTIAGDGRQSRRFVYVEDLADGVVAALRPEAAGRVYNLVGEEDVSVRQIADAVRAAVGDVPIVHTEGRAGDFAGARVSGRRAADELGWTATTPFAEGVARYVDWCRGEAAPAPPPPRARAHPAPWAARLRPVVWILGLAAIVLCAVMGYVAAIESIGLGDGAAGTVGLVSAVAALCTLAARGPWPAAWAWSAGGAAVGPLVVPAVAHDLHVARLDVVLLVLGAAGAGLVLALLDGGRRALRAPAPSSDAA